MEKLKYSILEILNLFEENEFNLVTLLSGKDLKIHDSKKAKETLKHETGKEILIFKIKEETGIVILKDKNKIVFSICYFYNTIPYIISSFFEFIDIIKATESIDKINEKQKNSFVVIKKLTEDNRLQRVSISEVLGILLEKKILTSSEIYKISEPYRDNPIKVIISANSDLYINNQYTWTTSSLMLTSILFATVDRNIFLDSEYNNLASMLISRTTNTQKRESLIKILNADDKTFNKLYKLLQVLENEEQTNTSGV